MSFAYDQDVVYHGYQRPVGGSVIAVEDLDGNQIGLLRHVIRHSPTGMQWGYTGSGPADCARSLLLAALSEDATCEVVWDDSEDRDVPYDSEVHDAEMSAACLCCDDGYRRLPYQQFKFEFVAGWGDEWTMRRSEILSWLEQQQAAA